MSETSMQVQLEEALRGSFKSTVGKYKQLDKPIHLIKGKILVGMHHNRVRFFRVIFRKKGYVVCEPLHFSKKLNEAGVLGIIEASNGAKYAMMKVKPGKPVNVRISVSTTNNLRASYKSGWYDLYKYSPDMEIVTFESASRKSLVR